MAEPADTKRRLLDAAAAEFAVYGLEGARMRAIVGRAGINERMIYHHFGSKEGLYRAVLVDLWSAIGGAVGQATEERAGEPPFDALRRGLLGIARTLVAHPLLLQLAMHESLIGWKHLAPVSIADLPPALVDAFRRGQKDGLIRADCRFETLYIAALGAALSAHLLPPRFRDVRPVQSAKGRLVANVIELVLRGARQ
jgi:AcrR family transcriptional regulator